mmetsp:Transcript_11766/g.41564  ORF Transcript_11766/g.41564 Transcript_11766/m.41564 type:complete len:200 (+) Transcript_11766:1583-2182(+)
MLAHPRERGHSLLRRGPLPRRGHEASERRGRGAHHRARHVQRQADAGAGPHAPDRPRAELHLHRAARGRGEDRRRRHHGAQPALLGHAQHVRRDGARPRGVGSPGVALLHHGRRARRPPRRRAAGPRGALRGCRSRAVCPRRRAPDAGPLPPAVGQGAPQAARGAHARHRGMCAGARQRRGLRLDGPRRGVRARARVRA